MTHTLKVVAVLAVLAAAAIVIVLKQGGAESASDAAPAAVARVTETTEASEAEPAPQPHLVDLGASKCIPCKAMAPILEALSEDFEGQFQVTFIDVWKDETAGEAYGIRMIPTQIFFDAEGKELFRHEGFYSREDILGKWRELGYEFEPAAAAEVGE
ncbi:MAG: thioredoxin family protein [Phycisphaeraceae bacterium]